MTTALISAQGHRVIGNLTMSIAEK
jgi:hypothetical protein